jgi:HD-GYP domain-containing protein (c-di-GMP phosphodiesterase class II)
MYNDSSENKIWENQRKIPVSELALGHFVARLSSPWNETPFLIQGFIVGDLEELTWIKNHCEWVIIDVKKSQISHQKPITDVQNIPKEAKVLRTQPITQVSMRESLAAYLNLRERVTHLTEYFHRLNKRDIQENILLVKDISASLSKNLPALVWLTRIKHEDKYTAEHCMNVCILSMGLASALGWNQTKAAQVGVAGLLHDLGKIDIDPVVLNKPGRLTKEEFELLKTHPMNGYVRLKNEPDLPPQVLAGILHHHERPDGKGYPKGLSDFQIDDMAKLIAIVDAYDAITSDRVYQKARSHHEAMSILWTMRGTQFDHAMVERFIQFLGWVTPGAIVELSTGDIGVVVQALEGQRLYPNVRILIPTSRGYRLGARWNLSEMDGLHKGEPIHITRVFPDGHLGIRIENYAHQLLED